MREDNSLDGRQPFLFAELFARLPRGIALQGSGKGHRDSLTPAAHVCTSPLATLDKTTRTIGIMTCLNWLIHTQVFS